MAIRKYKPTTPGRRGASGPDFAEITRGEPEKSLVRPLHSRGGRNVHADHRPAPRRRPQARLPADRLPPSRQGRRAREGRARKYDPNRTARIALLHYANGEKRYILCPQGLKQGDRVENGASADIRPGNCLPLRNIPTGTIVHAIELARRRRQDRPLGRPGVQLLAKEGGYAQLRMPSGEIRRVGEMCRAAIGEVGNAEQGNIKLGKAGRNRWKGKRPSVRGVAMNPVDHPLGGGEGKSSGGRHPVSPSGKPEGRTRQAHKPSDRMIVRRRSKKKR